MKMKKISMNLLSSIINFVIILGINFFLSPYIVKTVGTAANGFIALANNFVTYASIATIAINSMAGRFMTIKIHQGKHDEANKYFNSILIANIVLSAIIFVLLFFCIWHLEKLIIIPTNLLFDVKLLFSLVFISFLITTIFTVFSSATFVSNRLDLQYRKLAESNIIKAILLLILFYIFKPSITFVGMATVFSTIYVVGYNYYFTKKLLPKIKINKKDFDFHKVKEVFFAGIWNTITNIGNMLFEGLDILISNIFIGPLAMGKMALSKTITSIYSSLLSTVANAFNPQLTIDYAKDGNEKLLTDLKHSMKLSSFFANIPLAFFVVFGLVFYSLWIPGEDINLIYKITLLSIQGVIVSGVITPMWYVYTITNKLKANSIIVLGTSVVSVLITVILLKTTNLGLYAIAGTSTTINIIRNLSITPMYTAHCLNAKKTIFYPLIIRYILVTATMIGIFTLVKNIILPTTWLMLFVSILVCGVVGLVINFVLLLNRLEREAIIKFIFKKRGVKNEMR